jgi:hypothetical protein
LANKTSNELPHNWDAHAVTNVGAHVFAKPVSNRFAHWVAVARAYKRANALTNNVANNRENDQPDMSSDFEANARTYNIALNRLGTAVKEPHGCANEFADGGNNDSAERTSDSRSFTISNSRAIEGTNTRAD